MKENKWKKFARYYKPYLGSFAADMFFAILGAAVTLIIPMVVRYITGTVIYEEPDKAMKDIAVLAVVMIALVAVEFGMVISMLLGVVQTVVIILISLTEPAMLSLIST